MSQLHFQRDVFHVKDVRKESGDGIVDEQAFNTHTIKTTEIFDVEFSLDPGPEDDVTVVENLENYVSVNSRFRQRLSSAERFQKAKKLAEEAIKVCILFTMISVSIK